MAGFLYFKPHTVATVTREQVIDWGLGYAFGGEVTDCQVNANNFTQLPGRVFADPKQHEGRTVLMRGPDEQTWRKIPRSDLYVGMWNDAKPTPADLLRQPAIPGHSVKLADTGEWMIPIVRRFDTLELVTKSNLPCYMELDEEGNWQKGQVLDVHAYLWEVTEPIAAALLNEYVHGQPPQVADADIMRCIVALLTANYRVSAAELSLMRALTNEMNTHVACMAACDWPAFLDWNEEINAKKNNPPAAGG